MLKKTLICLLLFVLAWCFSGCGFFGVKKGCQLKQEGTKDFFIAKATGNFTVGEKFYYKVHWLGLYVGWAQLEIKDEVLIDERPACHIILTAATNKFYSFFYKVDGFAESYFDKETFRPIKYFSKTQLCNKFVFKKMEYDYVRQLVYAEDKKGKYEVAIDDKVIDPLGIFYYFRTNPVVFNKPIDLTINGGKKNFLVTFYVKKKRFVNTHAGRFNAFLVKPTTHSERQFDDSLNAPGSMTLWFSADEKRIPLMVTLKVPLGTAQAIISKLKVPQLNLTANN